MTKPNLSEHEWDVLRDVTEMHEVHGHTIIHENMREDDIEAVGELMLRGFVEIRATAKDQGHGQRRVVPTPVGRRLIAELNTADAVGGVSA